MATMGHGSPDKGKVSGHLAVNTFTPGWLVFLGRGGIVGAYISRADFVRSLFFAAAFAKQGMKGTEASVQRWTLVRD